MKKLILSMLLCATCVTTKAQINKDTVGLNLPITNGRIVYTGVVKVNGKTKDELYRNAQQWLIDKFKTQKDVIQNKDKEEGIVFGRAIWYFNSTLELGTNINWANHFTIKIECKDNKYRYLLYNMTIYNFDSGNASFELEILLSKVLGKQDWPWNKNQAKKALISNDKQLKIAILSLKDGMAKTNTDF